MSTKFLESWHEVKGFDCGYGGPFKPFALANFFQEAAGDHAEQNCIGMEAMRSRGLTWMLSRIDLRADLSPSKGDRVMVRTWHEGTDRLFSNRCLELRNSEGGLMAGAVYSYLVVDIERRRPLRPERILDEGLSATADRPYPDLDPGLGDRFGFPALPDARLAKAFAITPGSRHIDHNGHVNNAYIIDWLSDAAPVERRAGGELARITLDFVSEVRFGQELEVLWMPVEGKDTANFAVALRAGALIAKAYIAWR